MTENVSGRKITPDPASGPLPMWVNPERIGAVSGLAFSPDGSQILSCTKRDGRNARVWNIQDGRIDFAFPGIFPTAAMSPAEPIVAVGSFETSDYDSPRSVKLYDLARRAEIWSIPGANGLAAFSGDGNLIVTASWDSSTSEEHLKLWSIPERHLVHDFPTHALIGSIALSPDGRWIAAASEHSAEVEIYSVSDRKQQHLAASPGVTRVLAFSPDSQLLATAGIDQIVRLWSVASGQLAAEHIGHTDEITSLNFFPDGRRLVSAARDGTVRLWSTAPSIKSPPALKSEELEDRLLISPNGRRWISTSPYWQALRVGDPRTGSVSGRLIQDGAMARNEGFDDDGRAVVSSAFPNGGERIELGWHSIDNLSLIRSVLIDGDVGQGACHAFCPAGGLFATGESDGSVRVWSAQTGKLLQSFGMPDHIDHRPKANNLVSRIEISADGLLLAAGMTGNTEFAVYSLAERKLLFSGHARPLFVVVDNLVDPGVLAFLCFSPDGKILATTDLTEPVIHLWEARTGREIGRLPGHRDHTVAVSFSPDNKTLASTGGDGSVKLWHLGTRREVATLMESGAAGPLAFSGDGSELLVAIEEGVRIFQASALAEIDRQK
jgi:WD40 repeat protein